MRRFLIASFASLVLVSMFAPAAHCDGPKSQRRPPTLRSARSGRSHGRSAFVVGYEKGMKAAATSGRPPLYFFTATGEDGARGWPVRPSRVLT